jgi:hypothetical protein
MSERIMSDEFDGLDATEKTGIRAALIALIRCRALAAKIANELRNERPEHFVDKLSLAEIHASLERAADVLRTVKGSQRGGVSVIERFSPHTFAAVVRTFESRGGKLKIQLKRW